MKSYELTVLFHPDLEMNLDPALDKVKKVVENAGGKIAKTENDGKKHLAYEIESQDFAIYYYYTVNLPSEAPMKISSSLNIADEVLRYLLVRSDDRRAKAEARAKAKAEAKAARQAEKGETVKEPVAAAAEVKEGA